MPGTNLTDLIEPYVIDLHQEDVIPKNSHKPKIIAFYAEKGGVGKTTLCLTLAQTMAAQGSRVLIYDCDVQRSLTAWTFGNNIEINARNNPRLVNKLDNFIHNLPYDRNELNATLYEQIIDEDHNVKPAYASKIKENLYLVCGDSCMPLLDEKIAHTEAMTSNEFSALAQWPNQKSARPYYAIMKTAEKYQVDYVFLDMNPYPGILNRCLLMSSHYIVIPALLDFFCETMMNMMSKKLENWNAKTKKIAHSTNRQGGMFPWPNHRPKFLGYITSIYMLYPESMPSPSELSNGDGWASEAGTDYENPDYYKTRKNAQHYAESIDNEAKTITRRLSSHGLVLKEEQYVEVGLQQRLGEIPYYHSLGDISNILHVPVPFLEPEGFYKKNKKDDLFYKVTKHESVKMIVQRNRFRDMYAQLCTNITTLIELDDQ